MYYYRCVTRTRCYLKEMPIWNLDKDKDILEYQGKLNELLHQIDFSNDIKLCNKCNVMCRVTDFYDKIIDALFMKLKMLKIGDMFKLKLLKLYYKLSYNLLPSYFDRYRDIIEQDSGRVLRINYIHPPLIRRVYAECSHLFQLTNLINNIRADANDAILQQIELRINSNRTFSYNVSMVYLSAYDPVCPIGIKNCYMYVCQLEAC